MNVTPLAEVERRPRRVAVGMFDGVHQGHRDVIAGADTVVTFDPHPTTVVHPAAVPKLITTPQRKAELVAALGVDEMVVVTFDEQFAEQSASSFLDDVLVRRLGATHVSVGENFRFGHRAQGDTELLASDTRFETRVVALREADGEVVSSSHIRGLVLGGAVDYANRLLVEPFARTGVVVHGDKRGRDLGFPTANLVPDGAYVTPGHGVYACVANGRHAAAVNVGVRPMFETGRGELIEAFLLDFSDDLYGTELELVFHRRLRGERRFPSVEGLIEQMQRDVDETRSIVGPLLPSSAA